MSLLKKLRCAVRGHEALDFGFKSKTGEKVALIHIQQSKEAGNSVVNIDVCKHCNELFVEVGTMSEKELELERQAEEELRKIQEELQRKIAASLGQVFGRESTVSLSPKTNKFDLN